jgi:hypothetical protein
MSHGGKRTGAGRRKGQVSDQTRRRVEVAERALAGGVSPLDVMLDNMRFAYAKAGDLLEGMKLSIESGAPVSSDKMKELMRMRAMAQTFASDAAPYVHPKLAAVTHEGNQDNPVAFQVISGVPRAAADADENLDVVNGHH